jgi:predicted amidohydrolase
MAQAKDLRRTALATNSKRIQHVYVQDIPWLLCPAGTRNKRSYFEEPSPVFKVGDASCSVVICHDSRYPELTRLPVLAGARVVFYISHESSVAWESKLSPYRAQVQARAVENSVFFVHANAPADDARKGSHGQSRIVLPDGNLISEASIFEEEILFADLELARAVAENALRSLDGEPLSKWWRDGLGHVRVID